MHSTPHISLANPRDAWPALPQSAWSDTCATLQLWMQVVGKIRLALTPPINHTWNVTLYPTVRGVTTSPMPYGSRTLQIDFDFIDHVLLLQTSDPSSRTIALTPMTVADFYRRVMSALDELHTPVRVWPVPCEIPNCIPFEQDDTHQAYDPVYAQRFFYVLLQTTRVFTEFRSRFRGKVSPVHLFWGALDLACTRFSGRTAPPHPSMPGLPDRVTRDAYSHEVSSCGFWPGAAAPPAPGSSEPTFIEAFFYSYAYPEPPGYAQSAAGPSSAHYDSAFGEFIFSYEAMRQSSNPDAALLDFLQSTYDAAANCARWDRAALDVGPPTA